MPKLVFISYAREDSRSARHLYKRLTEEGFTPWIDSENILPGQKWKTAIKRAIREANAFIALLSENSVNRKGFLQKELRLGIDLLGEIPDTDIYLIPARLDDCDPKHEDLKELQWVDLFPDFEVGFLRISKALRIDGDFKLDGSGDGNSGILSALRDFQSAADSIAASLHQASRTLRQAEHHFDSKAYGPFWDAIEGATQHLSDYLTEVHRLTEGVDPYRIRFKGQATSISLGLTLESVPSPTPVVDELQRLIRKGQSDFEFATIWEHRKSRSIMVAGFASLDDAINSVGSTLDAYDKLIGPATSR